MDRILWAKPSLKPIERKRFTYAAVATTFLGGAALGGGAAALWGGGKKKNNAQFNYYETPEYRQLYNLLYKGANEGFPEMMKEDYWGPAWQQSGQDIRELFEAKKSLGAGTPEYTQLQNARGSLMSNLIGQQMGARQNYAQLLSRTVPQPITTYTPEGPSGLEQLLMGVTPLASAGLSSYMQSQNPMNQAMAKYLTNLVTPKSPETVFGYGGIENFGKNTMDRLDANEFITSLLSK